MQHRIIVLIVFFFVVVHEYVYLHKMSKNIVFKVINMLLSGVKTSFLSAKQIELIGFEK